MSGRVGEGLREERRLLGLGARPRQEADAAAREGLCPQGPVVVAVWQQVELRHAHAPAQEVAGRLSVLCIRLLVAVKVELWLSCGGLLREPAWGTGGCG